VCGEISEIALLQIYLHQITNFEITVTHHAAKIALMRNTTGWSKKYPITFLLNNDAK